MRYVGNTGLSPQIQERILTTFQQTLSLAREDNRQEALLGCDFILRLDPLFEPARRLQDRLNQTEGEVDVADLADLVEGQADAAGEQAMPDSVSSPAASEVASPLESTPFSLDEPPSEVPEGAADLPGRMAQLFEQRNDQELLQLAREHLDVVADNPELRQLTETAAARFEAEPYVRNFIDAARSAKAGGDLKSARNHLEKARELDPSHPELAVLEADLGAATPTAAPPEVPRQDVGAQPSSTAAPTEVPPPIDLHVDLPPPLASSAPAEPTLEVSEEPAEPRPSAQAIEVAQFEEVSLEEAPVEGPAFEEPFPAESPAVVSLGAEPAARLDSESEQRIQALLSEGQEAFEEGQYQSAIDAWSRIFLIDIDHAETSRRIELARKLKAEVERQVEESFHEAVSLLESGKLQEAREAFQKTLELQPSHLAARDYLEKLDAGDLAPGPPEPPETAPFAETEPAPDGGQLADDAAEADLVLDRPVQPTPIPDDIYIPPEEEAPPTPAPRKRSFALIAGVVLVIVLAVAWFVYSKWDTFFPASTADLPSTGQPQIDPIERARELHEAGDTAMAINVLRRLPPGNEQYAEAQSLIAMWETGDQPDESLSAGPTEADLARRELLVERAAEASEEGENLLALELLEQADQITALGEEELEIQTVASDMLETLQRERELFDQGDWEYALPELWRMHEADPDNRDVVRLMVDSYFNLGLRDLQRGDPRAAKEKFEEALELAPGDAGLQRMAEFATAYTQRPSDMLYRIFVKYQPFR